MIWFAHERYEPGRCARRLAEIYRHSRLATRCMAAIASAAALTLALADLGCVYAL